METRHRKHATPTEGRGGNLDLHLLRLDPGEKIIEKVIEYVKHRKMDSGFLTGIGATASAEIAWFDPEKQVYQKRVIDEPCEITSIVGNIAWFDDQPVVHAHVTLGKSDFSVVGGHLMEATVGPTCELWIVESDMDVFRVATPNGSLKLLQLKGK